MRPVSLPQYVGIRGKKPDHEMTVKLNFCADAHFYLCQSVSSVTLYPGTQKDPAVVLTLQVDDTLIELSSNIAEASGCTTQ